MSVEFTCPCCGQRLLVSSPTPRAEYDPSDPIEKRGFDDEKWNCAHPFNPDNPTVYRRNPFQRGSDEFYRWNRGSRRVR